MKSTLKDFMTPRDREAMTLRDEHGKVLSDLPTWHCYCLARTGRARPGKTARDKGAKAR